MKKKIGILAVLIMVALLAVGWALFMNTEVGMARTVGAAEPSLSESEYSSIPPSVIDDATRLAGEIAGKSQDKFRDALDQLLATYISARDRDVVVIFNSGGWGWKPPAPNAGWSSILDGIKSELDGLGYNSLVLSYQRTSKSLGGCIREFASIVTRYPAKAKVLAERVQFLTDHIPNLKVIIAGESTGTVISDKTMSMLQDDTRVYSIQTGTPFWHKPMESDRTLLMNSNGKTIDTFSYGRISDMVCATVKNWLGLLSKDDSPGRILNWLRAPGHDYSWQYPGVCSGIVKFLDENFGSRK